MESNVNRRLLRAAALAGLIASVASGPAPVDAQSGQPETTAPRVLQLFHHTALGASLPPQAMAAIATPVGIEDPKTVAIRVASAAMPMVAGADIPAATWSPIGQSADHDGTTHTRLQQRIRGLRVFGAEAIVHLDQSLNAIGLTGEVLVDADLDPLKPTSSLDAAIKAARFHLGLSDRLAVESGELLIYNPAIVDAGASANHIAYQVVLSSPDRDESYTALIDARDGKLLTSFSNIESARNREIRDMGNSTVLPGVPCHTETSPVGSTSPDCLAAHRFSGDTYNFLQRVFSRDGFDGAGATMKASVRYGNAQNAFWNGRQTVFGPGFATKDVVAHEWTHGLVAHTARLVNLNQSGALNESVADVMASMVDVDADWLIGEDLSRGAIRSLAEPRQFGQPGKVSDSEYYCGVEDNGGVHVNSGVVSHAAYLMAQGGSYNGRTIGAVGRDATALIVYRALTTYLTSGSGLLDAYHSLRASCADQFGGANSNTCVAVTNALEAAEMHLPACNGILTAPPDLYEGVTGDDVPTSANPLTGIQDHNFHDPGDSDWVRFDVAADASLRIETTALQAHADTVLRLTAGDGRTILAEDDDGGGNRSSRIDYTFVSGGTYYVRVVHYSAAAYGAATGYSLQMSPITNSGDVFEPDNSITTAKDIVPNGAPHIGHTFGSVGDADWVRLEVMTPGIVYDIRTENLLPQSDPYLFLYASDGTTLLASDDDGGGRLGAQLTWAAPAAGIYYIRVRAYDQTVFGPNTKYDLRVTTTGVAPDSFEPDDSTAAARPLALNTPQTHNFHGPSDHDWVSLAVAAETPYTIETSALQSRADTVLDVYDNAGALIATNDDSATGLAAIIVLPPRSAGLYFVRVRQHDARVFGSGTGYTLRVSSSACTGGDAFEPNDGMAIATPYGVANGTLQTHNHACAGDVDYIRFNAVQNMDYDIRTSGLGLTADTQLRLVDSAGTQLASDDDGGGGVASRIRWRATADGIYYVASRHRSPATFGPNTEYKFSITATGTSATADPHEIDDSIATAQPLSLVSPHVASAKHNFHVAGDVDWMVVSDLTPSARYAVETFDLGVYSDTVVEVYSGATLLARDDDGGGVLASRAVFDAPASGPVHVKVIHDNPTQQGSNTDYAIRVAPVSTAISGDQFEPDNTPAQARPLSTASAQWHDFHVESDVDWISFSAVAGHTYTIATANLGALSDTVVELYSGNGTVFLAANDDGGGGVASRLVHTAASNGPLHVRVRHFSAATAGAGTHYSLMLTEASDDGGDAFEIDNTPAQARALLVGSAHVDHNFHVAGDADWMAFPATSGVSYVIETFDLGPRSDTVVDLFAPNGTTLLRSNDDDGTSLASRIEWTASITATHFLRVTHVSPAALGSDTRYSVRVGTMAPCSGPFEPDNSPVQSSTSLNGSTGSPAVANNFTFGCAGDIDWIRLTNLTPGLRYGVETFNLGTAVDTVMTLFNESATTSLAENDDAGGSLGSRIEFTAGSGWQLHPGLATPRFLGAIGAINGVIYVAGGYSAGYPDSPSHGNWVTDVNAFDTRTNTWTSKTPLDVAQAGAVSAVYGGSLYVVGGGTPSGYTNMLRRYDPGTDSWTTLAPMPTARWAASGGVINGILYVVGGQTAHQFGFIQTAVAEAYNIATNTWTTVAPLPALRSMASAAVIDNQLYVAGGDTPDAAPGRTPLVRYDPSTNTWSSLEPQPIRRNFPSMVAVDRRLYLLGDRGMNAIIDVYDPISNTWTRGVHNELDRTLVMAAAVENRVYVVGGLAFGATPNQFTGRTESFVAGSSRGDHWVRLRHYSPTVFGSASYSVQLSALSDLADVHESDNTAATAKSLTEAAPHTGATSHNFHLNNDADWMYYDATPGRCYFETYNLGNRVDTFIGLYHADGVTLGSSDDEGAGPGASMIGVTFQATGRVYLKVTNPRFGGGGPGTQYSVRVRCVADAYEPDDSHPNLYPWLLVDGASHRRMTDAPGEIDWMQFYVPRAGIPVVIETLNLSAKADTVMYLYAHGSGWPSGGGTPIASNDDGGSEPRSSRIAWVSTSGGAFDVLVRHHSRYVFGPDTAYDVRVRTGTADQRSSDVSVVSGGGSGAVQLRVRPLVSADALKVQVFAKTELLSFTGAQSLIPGKNGEMNGVVRLLNSPSVEPIVFGAYLEGKHLAHTLAGNEALAFNFELTRPLTSGKTWAVVRVTLIDESGEVIVEDIPTVIDSTDLQPRINAIEPHAVPTESGGTFTVYGSNFVITPKVTLVGGGTTLELRDVRIGLDGSWIEASIPAQAKVGVYKVRVQNPDGGFTDSEADLSITRAGTSCDFSLSREHAIVSGAGGTLTVNVTTGDGCVWAPLSLVNWIRPVGAIERSGAGSVDFAISPSPSGAARGTAFLTIGSRTLAVDQVANRNPSMSSITNQSISRGTSTGPVPFTVSDDDDDAVTITASSSNQTLVPNGNIALGGDIARVGVDGLYATVNRTVTVTPVATELGQTTITLNANDGRGGTVTTTFTLTVEDSGGVGVPRDVRADAVGSIVDVQWAAPTVGLAPTTYRVVASRSPGGIELSATTSGTSLTLNLTGRAPGRWFIRVVGIAATGQESFPSAEVFVDIGAPGPPLNMTRTVTGPVVTLAWTPPESADAVSYVIRAGSSPGASDLAFVPVVGTSFTSPPVPNGTYYARVYAVNTFGTSGPSNEVVIVVGAPVELPGPPSNLQHTVNGNVVALSWQAAAGGGTPSGYVLRAGTAPGLSNIAVALLGNVSSFGPVSVPNGTYFARMHAVNSAGEGPASNEITIVVGAVVTAPGAPSGLTATVSGNAVSLVWSPPTSGGPVDQYVIDAGTTPGGSNIVQVAIGTGTSFAAGGVPPGTYFVRIRAVNASGSSGPSNEVVVQVR